jgi:RimJ/RimL family protein N-acetyltransferase
MVYLKVAEFNPNAKKLYEKVGLIETGKLPQFFYRHGKFWDYTIMSITKSQYVHIHKVRPAAPL